MPLDATLLSKGANLLGGHYTSNIIGVLKC